MKPTYEAPVCEPLVIETANIIAASNNNNGGGAFDDGYMD